MSILWYRVELGVIFKVMPKGFTLVEFLVVLGVLAIAVGSALLVLTSVLRGTNQANITTEVKQNGQIVLDTLDSQIRNAIGAECKNSSGVPVTCSSVSASKKYIKLIGQGIDPLHIKCFWDEVPKTQNGWIGTVTSTSENPNESDYSRVTNTDKISGVDIGNCNFSVQEATVGTLSPAIVSISFLVEQGVEAPSRQDFVTSVKFQTTISLRRY